MKILFFLTIFPLFVFSQSKTTNGFSVSPQSLSTEWTQVYNQSGVFFSAKIQNCANPDYTSDSFVVIIRMENSLDINFILGWDLNKWYSDALNKETMDSPTITQGIPLFAGSTLEGTCDSHSDKYYLYTFQIKKSSTAGSLTLTKLSFSNFKITVYEN